MTVVNSVNIKIGQLDGLGGKIKSGWLYPKNSILRPIFDKHLIKLSRTGVEKRLHNMFFNFFDQHPWNVVSSGKVQRYLINHATVRPNTILKIFTRRPRN